MRNSLFVILFMTAYANADDKSIAFVIDTTGSMSADIAGAIAGSEEIFRTMTTQDSDIKNFILVPFNDPDYGPATVTTSQSTFLAALHALSASGGGDCPELAMHGLQVAIENIYPRSTIFVFTDASAADYSLKDTIINLIQEKQCQIIYVLTGDCGDPTGPGHEIYEDTADASNGHVFDVEPGDVSDVIHYIEAHYHEVSIESLDLTSAPNLDTTFPIDSHLVGFSLSLSGSSPQLTLYNPSGVQVTDYWSVVHLANALVISVNGSAFAFGQWRVNTKVSRAYAVRITGTGFMEYEYGFSQHSDSPSPDYRPLVGVPTYILGKLSNLSSPGQAKTLDLVDMDGTPLSSANLTFRAGYEFQYVAGPVVTPTSLFRMKIKGTDEHGHPFQRITSTAVSAESDPCVVVDCNGHGTCVQLNGTKYKCTCEPGYNGMDCYYRDVCYFGNPCENGGTCLQDKDDFTCTCTKRYTGKNCSEEALCEPCNGHGTFSCACDRGYTGERCDSEIDWCKEPVGGMTDSDTVFEDLCAPHGNCSSSPDGATCVCAEGFTGEFCENEVTNKTWLGYRCAKELTPLAKAAGLKLCPSGEHCVPDNLDCYYLECKFPIGWCLPTYGKDDIYEKFAKKIVELMKAKDCDTSAL